MASDLPSQVEETLASCPRFRIVLVGNTGVGKSSLVGAVFNVVFNVDLPRSPDGTSVDVSHDGVGRADINHEYYSEANPRFILHDSMGFEPGSTDKYKIVDSFLYSRAARNAELPEQVHAIWLCIETPRTGSRLLQIGDEKLLERAKELNIPIIVVFTKYDMLVKEHSKAYINLKKGARLSKAKKGAHDALQAIGSSLTVPFVAVSTETNFKDKTSLLVKLTDVTRDHLREIGGSLWAIWATAQQINSRQKVELSISEGTKKYWLNLGASTAFSEHKLIDCIFRIHEDVLKIWNFNDPSNLLFGDKFMKGMFELIKPLHVQTYQSPKIDGTFGLMANVAAVAGTISSTLIPPALAAISGTITYQFLQGVYEKGVSNGRYLAAYIVDLILVLHEISMAVMADPPKSLSEDLVMDALNSYKFGSEKNHAKVKEMSLMSNVEDSISSVIWQALPVHERD